MIIYEVVVSGRSPIHCVPQLLPSCGLHPSTPSTRNCSWVRVPGAVLIVSELIAADVSELLGSIECSENVFEFEYHVVGRGLKLDILLLLLYLAVILPGVLWTFSLFPVLQLIRCIPSIWIASPKAWVSYLGSLCLDTCTCLHVEATHVGLTTIVTKSHDLF